MDLDNFFAWYFANNAALINIVIVAILGLVAGSLFYSLKKGGGPTEEQSALTNSTLSELEATLRRVLDSVPTRASALQSAGDFMDEELAGGEGPTGTTGQDDSELKAALENLQKDVGEKEKLIQELRTSLDNVSTQSPLTDDQKARIDQLEKDLKEAKSRLAEYEIIEDDIANLSLYKSENSKLKAELERFRRGKPGADEEGNVPQVSDIVAEFAAIVGSDEKPQTPLQAAAAVAKEASAEPAPASAPAPAPAPASESKPPPQESKADAPAPAPASEPAATEVSTAPLEVDPNKLIAEAAALPDAPQESKDEPEEDPKQKLISEFESFIKNG